MKAIEAEQSLRRIFPRSYLYESDIAEDGVDLMLVSAYLGVLPGVDTHGNVFLVNANYEEDMVFPEWMADEDIRQVTESWDVWEDPPVDFVPRSKRIDPIEARVAVEKVFPHAHFVMGEDSLLHIALMVYWVPGPDGAVLTPVYQPGSQDWEEMQEMGGVDLFLHPYYGNDPDLWFFDDLVKTSIRDLGWDIALSPELRDDKEWQQSQLAEGVPISDVQWFLEPFSGTQDLAAVVAGGEGHQTEFKASAHLNLHTGDEDREARLKIVRVAAGFLNAEGGTVLIGVTDDASVRGIDDDLRFVSRQNLDGYSLWITELLVESLGVGSAAKSLVNFEEIKDATVCRISVSRSEHEPVFANFGGTKGAFFVRVNASTRELNPQETQDYISSTFPREIADSDPG